MAEPAVAIDALGERRFLTFWLGDQLYALPADETAEVIRLPALARVPQGPSSLMGLGNLRGSVLPFASGRRLIGRPDAEPSRAIVLAGPAPVALAVDRIEALIAIDAARIATDQAEPAREPREQLRGAFQVPGGTDIAKILDVWPLLKAEFTQAPRAAKLPMGQVDVAAPSSGAPKDETERLVTFMVADQEFGLPLTRVREIIAPPETVAVTPHAETVVVGVMAYRETLLPLLSLRGLLGLTAASATSGREKVLVAFVAGTLVGLVADSVRTIVAADPSQVEPTPPMLAARTSGESRIRAIYRGDGGRRLIAILDPEQLFREDVMRKLGEDRGTQVAKADANQGPEGGELQVLVFRLGDDEFGLPIDVVDEVARVPDQVTRLPKTPKFLEGVINLRGEVLPVVDQRRRFDMPPAADLAARRLIVVRTDRHRAGLIVDAVSEVLRSTAEAVEPAPHLSGEATRLVQGVINLDQAGRMVLLLDPAELLTRAERGLLDAFKPDADTATA